MLYRIILQGCLIFSLLFSGLAGAEPSSKMVSVSGTQASPTININIADSNQLRTLKGVGANKAQAILDYRAQHGAFKSVDELANVKGIGERRFAQIQKKNPGRIVVQ